MQFRQAHVYILTNTYRTTFYIGVTADLRTRMWQHVHGEGSAFVKRYHLHELVFVEYFERITDAIDREKQLKRWHREWKLNLIRSVNPTMKCLKEDLDLL
jgi:putative endonuclease